MRGKTGSGHLVSLDINELYWPVNDQKWNAVFFFISLLHGLYNELYNELNQ